MVTPSTTLSAGETPADVTLFPVRDGNDPTLFWVILGLGERPSTREQLIALTMLEVAKVGPAAFNTRTVCAELGLTHPLIQHHFGSRDGLIAEAAHVTYRRYVTQMRACVAAAPPVPVERLRTALRAGVRFAIEMRGWGAVLNYYTFFSDAVADIAETHFLADHAALHEQQLHLLAQLLLDVWDDRITPTPDTMAIAAALADPVASGIFQRLLFTMHGLTVWRVGHVSAALTSPEQRAALEQAADLTVTATIEDLIRLAVADRSARPADTTPPPSFTSAHPHA